MKRLEGNPGKKRMPKGHVEPTGTIEPPIYVIGHALAVWHRVVGSMPPGVYAPTDVDVLAAYCLAVDAHGKAAEALLIEGHVVQTIHGPKRNPWGVVATQARAQIATLGTRLGLDPLARENINAPDQRPVGNFGALVGIDGGKK